MTNIESRLKLLPGEKVLMSSDRDILTLTNYRIRLNEKKKGASNYLSIALDCVASCGLVTKTKPLLLVIAAIFAISGITQSQDNLRYGLFIVAFIFVAIYFITRSAALRIDSNGGEKIIVPVKGMGRDDILSFLEAVEDARFRFIGKIGQ